VKAVVFERYGPPEVLRLAEVPRPVPKDDEVLIKVHAAAVNRTDAGLRSAEYWVARIATGLVRPKRKLRIPGSELAGVVEGVGSAVTEFQVGDEVFGLSPKTAGAHAEFVCVEASGPIAHKPTGLSFVEAAGVSDGLAVAYGFVKRMDLPGRGKVLIHGASGAIGTAAVQLAKHFGADVTAVCGTENVELLASLGADHVIDYKRQDFTKNGETYDFIFDSVGKTAHPTMSFKRAKGSLKPGGVYTSTDFGPYQQNAFLTPWTKAFGDKRVIFPIPHYVKKDLLFLKELIEAGTYRVVIDRTYPLEDVVEANRYVESGQKTGNVVLLISPDARPEQR
jgi:NADPH:quinone reductase-like Zn-dependent oxidoreductase